MKPKKSTLSVKPLLLKNLLLTGSLVSVLILSSFSTFATSTKTGNLPITSTVSNSCVVKSTDNINLGSYNPSSLVNLNGSGILSLICTKGAVVTASPSSGGSSLTGSGGSLSYSLYTDSAMTSKWGAGTQILSLTAGGTTSSNYTAYFESRASLTGRLTITQIQAAVPDFNPNYAYFYVYYSTFNTTEIYYHYAGQGSTTPQVANPYGTTFYGWGNDWNTSTTTSPDTLSYNYNVGTAYATAYYYMLPPGTTTGSTGSYGTSYQVPAGPGNTPITATSTTVTQPVNLNYYASLPYGQDVAPGVYTDTVVIQVTF